MKPLSRSSLPWIKHMFWARRRNLRNVLRAPKLLRLSLHQRNVEDLLGKPDKSLQWVSFLHSCVGSIACQIDIFLFPSRSLLFFSDDNATDSVANSPRREVSSPSQLTLRRESGGDIGDASFFGRFDEANIGVEAR